MAAKTGTYTLISSQTLGSAAASVTFSSIPSTYTDLMLVIAANAGGSTSAAMRFNADSGTNYSDTILEGSGTVVSSYIETGTTSIWAGSFYNTTTPTLAIHNIMDYSNATTYKTCVSRINYAAGYVAAEVGLWRNTTAITSVTLATGANFSTGSTFKLYGIEAAK
jgi:hypothetical protein